MKCSLCCLPLEQDSFTQLGCLHRFHPQCLSHEWLTHGRHGCPLCSLSEPSPQGMCSWCLQPFNERGITRLNCRHAFHPICYHGQWNMSTSSDSPCPLCHGGSSDGGLPSMGEVPHGGVTPIPPGRRGEPPTPSPLGTAWIGGKTTNVDREKVIAPPVDSLCDFGSEPAAHRKAMTHVLHSAPYTQPLLKLFPKGKPTLRGLLHQKAPLKDILQYGFTPDHLVWEKIEIDLWMNAGYNEDEWRVWGVKPYHLHTMDPDRRFMAQYPLGYRPKVYPLGGESPPRSLVGTFESRGAPGKRYVIPP